jgi:acyl-CoA thioester hydrolase
VDDKVRFIEHVSHIRVRYADTDKMGVVYYAKYFEYFEVARTEMLRACGLPYAEIESAGYGLPVLDASARYLKGAKYDDLLRVTATMEAKPSTRLEISYSVHQDSSEELVAEGATTLVFVSSATGKPSRPPAIYLQALNRYLETDRATHTE